MYRLHIVSTHQVDAKAQVPDQALHSCGACDAASLTLQVVFSIPHRVDRATADEVACQTPSCRVGSLRAQRPPHAYLVCMAGHVSAHA